ncbi:MAG: 5'-methylthioadenosine/S-adenosylhomocysteine nucleosidase [Puniceicoccales bacterium]|jgi:nucleoside phosphorylase|nr:5'-methylthioadenosine/S-adenosylhomocysteine nucleosidase [Puniceicoccales bacterium]
MHGIRFFGGRWVGLLGLSILLSGQIIGENSPLLFSSNPHSDPDDEKEMSSVESAFTPSFPSPSSNTHHPPGLHTPQPLTRGGTEEIPWQFPAFSSLVPASPSLNQGEVDSPIFFRKMEPLSTSLNDPKGIIVLLTSQNFEHDALIQALARKGKARTHSLRYKRDFPITPGIVGKLFYYREHKVMVVVTGENMLAATFCTQAICTAIPRLRAVIFVGIGGGIHPDLRPGDICVPNRWTWHTTGYVYNPEPPPDEEDEDEEDKEKIELSYRQRHPSDLPHFGPYFPALPIGTDGQKIESISCDERLLWGIRTLCRTTLRAPESRRSNMDGDPTKILIDVRGASGSIFVDNTCYRKYVLEEGFDAAVVDMETYAAAAVCHHYHIPFMAIRAISDQAGAGSAPSAIDRGGRERAAINAGWFLKSFLNLWILTPQFIRGPHDLQI